MARILRKFTTKMIVPFIVSPHLVVKGLFCSLNKGAIWKQAMVSHKHIDSFWTYLIPLSFKILYPKPSQSDIGFAKDNRQGIVSGVMCDGSTKMENMLPGGSKFEIKGK